MTQLNDEKLRALRSALGYVTGGNIDDMELEYLRVIKGATANQINECWMEVFMAFYGYTEKRQINALAYNYLGALGHQQETLDERWLSYWRSVF